MATKKIQIFFNKIEWSSPNTIYGIFERINLI
jgi:hypothetical protein